MQEPSQTLEKIYTQEITEVSPLRRKNLNDQFRDFHKERKSSRGTGRSKPNLTNRTGNFETKRQEVLKRKKQLEQERLEKLSQRIKQKEEKFKKNQEILQERRSQSRDRKSFSSKRSQWIL